MASIVFQWLDRIGLGDAIPAFEAKGITTPQALMNLKFDHYDEVGVTHVADRRRLLELVNRVRQAANKNQEKPAESGGESSVPTEAGRKEAAAQAAAQPRASTATGTRTDSRVEKPIRASGAVEAQLRAALAEVGASSDDVDSFCAQLLRRPDAAAMAATPTSVRVFFRRWQEDASGRTTARPKGATGSGGAGAAPGSSEAAPPPPPPGSSTDAGGVPASRRRAPAASGAGSFDRDGFEVGARPRPGRRARSAIPAAGTGTGAAAGAAAGGKAGIGSAPPGAGAGKASHPMHRSRSDGAPVGGSSSAVLSSIDDGPKIRVVVRKRPLNRTEVKTGDLDVIDTITRRTSLVHEAKQKVDLTRYTETHEFTFDDVFDHTCDTAKIYQHTARPLIASVFAGRKATCFAYGQTGSGKTFTMMGDPKRGSPGLYSLAARDLFVGLRRPEFKSLRVVVSFFEIYGGKLFDLLNARKVLKCLVDAQQNVVVKGLSEQAVSSMDALMRVIDHGNNVRSTGTTGANADSSRSHAILQIELRTRSGRPRGRFSFIDLAGSERGADTTHNDRRTRLEGAEINKSLLALKECIRSLYQEHDHTPFRGSKLTQVLKDSFVGNSRTCMIATVSPASTNCEHTLNTLRYAYRVKEIRRDDGSARDDDPPHGTGHLQDNPRSYTQFMRKKGAPSSPGRDFDEGGGAAMGGAGVDEDEAGVSAELGLNAAAATAGESVTDPSDGVHGTGSIGGAARPPVAAVAGKRSSRGRAIPLPPSSTASDGASEPISERAAAGPPGMQPSKRGSPPGPKQRATGRTASGSVGSGAGAGAEPPGRRQSGGTGRRRGSPSSAALSDVHSARVRGRVLSRLPRRGADASAGRSRGAEQERVLPERNPARGTRGGQRGTAKAGMTGQQETKISDPGDTKAGPSGNRYSRGDPSRDGAGGVEGVRGQAASSLRQDEERLKGATEDPAGLAMDVLGDEKAVHLLRAHRQQVLRMTEFLRQEMELVTDVRAVAAMGMRAYVDRVEEMLGDKLFLIDGMGEALVQFKKVKGWADEEEAEDEDEEEVRDGVTDGGEDTFAGGDEKRQDEQEGGQGPGFAEHHLPGHSSDGIEGEDVSPPDAPPGHAQGRAVHRPILQDDETGDKRARQAAAVSLTSPHSADGGASLDAGVGLEYDERYHGEDDDNEDGDNDDEDGGGCGGGGSTGDEGQMDGAMYSARTSRASEGEGGRVEREDGDQGAGGRRPLPPGSPGSRAQSSGLSPGTGRASAPHTARISLAGLRAAASAAAQGHSQLDDLRGSEGESDDDEVMIESPDD